MDIVLGAIIILLGLYIALYVKQRANYKNRSNVDGTEKENRREPLPIIGAYQQRWMFTYNEKDAYQKLQKIAEEKGYTVFAKVRLLDLVEPKRGNPKYKTYFNKIKSKHVDFVLCDKKLVAKIIIELDDSSHDTKDRKERDAFVDEVLKSTGYKIIHTRAITEEIKEQIS